MNKMMIILGVVVLVILGGVLLFGSSQTNQPVTQDAVQETTESTDSTDSGSMDSTDSMTEGVKTFEIENVGLSFTPNEIRVKAGDTVKITFKDTFGTHDFVIDEFNVRTPLLNAGQEATIEFVADQPGTYQFYCSVPGHREAGMWGTLTVE